MAPVPDFTRRQKKDHLHSRVEASSGSKLSLDQIFDDISKTHRRIPKQPIKPARIIPTSKALSSSSLRPSVDTPKRVDSRNGSLAEEKSERDVPDSSKAPKNEFIVAPPPTPDACRRREEARRERLRMKKELEQVPRFIVVKKPGPYLMKSKSLEELLSDWPDLRS